MGVRARALSLLIRESSLRNADTQGANTKCLHFRGVCPLFPGFMFSMAMQYVIRHAVFALFSMLYCTVFVLEVHD